LSTSGSKAPAKESVELSKRSVVILFTVGAIMLAAPVGTVLSENSACRTDTSSCIHSEAYRYLVSSFPYVMLGGGILIAYNMKRISDSINSPALDDEDEEGEDDGSLASYS
jgi:hypothetical protein